MRDPRYDRLADVLVRYSTRVRAGQLVRVSGSTVAEPLLEAVYEAVLRAGAHPLYRATPDGLSDLFFELASDEQLGYVNPVALHEIATVDATIGAWADANTKSTSRVDPAKLGKVSAARKPIMEVFMKRAAATEAGGSAGHDHQATDEDGKPIKPLRWVGTQFPCQASAQDAEMSLRQYAAFCFKACLLDEPDPVAAWERVRESQQVMTDWLNDGRKQLHYQAPNGTDLRVNVEGMRWINCAGECNMPDGEVFTGPNLKAADGGVNGYVRYSFPAVHNGREVHGIELWFEHGRVVKARAEKNEDFLLAMLDQDPGARSLGEIAIGTNYSITQYSKNTLFDEKIGGTFHAAVGESYPETGCHNKSGLHWDMVCDLRRGDMPGSTNTADAARAGGTIHVDGQCISEGGKFTMDGWPGN